MRDVGDGDGDDMAAGILRIGIGYGMHRVVVILGVGRIDGDEGHVAPVLAAGQRRRARRLGFVEHRARKRMRNVVGMDGDQADGALALERAEPLDDGAGGQAEAAVPRDFDRDEIAVDRARRGVGRNAQFAAELLLVDRHQPPAAAGKAAKNAERAMLGAIDQLDDAAAWSPRRLRARCGSARGRRRRRLRPAGARARRDDADDGRRAMRLLVPFGRPRQKFAVAVAAGDVGEHDRRQGAGMMQPLAAAVDAGLRRQVRAACG